ncbi:MAG TPA: radical SAM protein [Patescibacteria group bacterium]|nr:radical SAM protein [Patescibacteria group bacterium]
MIFDPRCNFCLFRIPETGGRVIWQITNRCNYSCSYCIFSSTFTKPADELSTEEAKRVIRELKEAGFTHLKITGGEPFTRMDMLDLLRFADEQKFIIDISTNASIITDAIADTLASLHISNVHVSLDGHTQKLQEDVRGPMTFERTIRGIKKLVERGVYTRIGCLIYKNNENQLEEMIKFCSELGVQEIIFSYLEPVGKMRGDSSMVSTRSIDKLKKELDELAKKYSKKISVHYSFTEEAPTGTCGTCPGMTRFLSIDHTGRISPCTWVAERAPEFISKNTLHEKPLRDILEEEQLQTYSRFTRQLSTSGLTRCPMADISLFQKIQQIDQSISNKFEFPGTAKYDLQAPIYPFSTEHLSAYPPFNLHGKRVLTITGSGDHAILACLLGAKHVFSFDINLFANAYSDLKREGLLRFSYHEFKNFFLKENPEPFAFSLFEKIKQFLPFPTRYLFEHAYERYGNSGKQLRASPLFRSTYERDEKTLKHIPFIQSEEAFQIAKEAVRTAEFQSLQSDIRELPKQLPEHEFFDAIFLSNIADHSHKLFSEAHDAREFRDQIIAPLLSRLSPGGVLAAAYLFDIDHQYESKPRNEMNDQEKRSAIFHELPGIRYEEIYFPSAINETIKDGLALIWK